MHLNAINQRPRRLQGLRAAIGQERLPQARDLGAIDLGEVAVQSGKLGASLCRRDLGTQIHPALLKLIQPPLKTRRAKPIGNRIDQAIELALHGLQLAAPADQARAGLGAKPIPLRCEFGDEGCHQFRLHEPCLKRLKNLSLNRLPAYAGPIIAGATCLGHTAGQIIAPHAHEGLAAGAANDLAAQQMLRAALLPKPALWCRGSLTGVEFGALRLQPCLYPLPERIIDDAQLRELLGQHFGTCIAACDALASRRVFQPAPLVPQHFPDIKAVAQDPGRTCWLAANGPGDPMPAAGTWNAILVQAGGDGFGALAGGEFGKNTPHHLSLRRVNLTEAAFWLPVAAHDPAHHPVTVANAAA